jgi:hypothetical protein
LSKANIEKWRKVARNANNPQKQPCTILLSVVSWRITGKDAAKKSFNKELRIDVPAK